MLRNVLSSCSSSFAVATVVGVLATFSPAARAVDPPLASALVTFERAGALRLEGDGCEAPGSPPLQPVVSRDGKSILVALPAFGVTSSAAARAVSRTCNVQVVAIARTNVRIALDRVEYFPNYALAENETAVLNDWSVRAAGEVLELPARTFPAGTHGDDPFNQVFTRNADGSMKFGECGKDLVARSNMRLLIRRPTDAFVAESSFELMNGTSTASLIFHFAVQPCVSGSSTAAPPP